MGYTTYKWSFTTWHQVSWWSQWIGVEHDDEPMKHRDAVVMGFYAASLLCLKSCLVWTSVLAFLFFWLCEYVITLDSDFLKKHFGYRPGIMAMVFLDPAVVPWFSQRTKPPFTEFAGKIHEFSSMLPTFSNDIPISWWLWHRKNLPWTLADFHHGASLAQAGRPSKNFTWFDPIRWNFATRRLWGSEDFFPVDIVWIITSP